MSDGADGLGPDFEDRASIIARRGGAAAAAVGRLRAALSEQMGPVGASPSELIELLDDQLRDWQDTDVASVIDAISDRLGEGRHISVQELRAWINAHNEHREWVGQCVRVEPPAQVQIKQVLSVAGSQKIVFLANWALTDREIVLKEFLDPDAAEIGILRELQPHPLSMQHPNIIETHKLTNSSGKDFLAERFLRALSDEIWSDQGAMESANLLHGIASALAFVHERGRIHGDVKPDNIGYEHPNYILLDFGVSRPAEDFAEGDQTGSLRTRAPELLVTGSRHTSQSDVWALGATVFRGLLGRFPLYESADERTPRITDQPARDEHEHELARRASDRYEELVLAPIGSVPHDELRRLLGNVLRREPDRPEAAELAAQCRSSLAALVRTSASPLGPAQSQRITQLESYLPRGQKLSLMPERRRRELAAELHEMLSFPGFSGEQRDQLQSLERIVRESYG